jgi:hypothetical protein
MAPRVRAPWKGIRLWNILKVGLFCAKLYKQKNGRFCHFYTFLGRCCIKPMLVVSGRCATQRGNCWCWHSNIFRRTKWTFLFWRFLSFLWEYMLNDAQNNLHSYRLLQLQRINHRDELATCKSGGPPGQSECYLGDFTEMHLPHKTSLDRARDLRVLIFNAESCSEMTRWQLSKGRKYSCQEHE